MAITSQARGIPTEVDAYNNSSINEKFNSHPLSLREQGYTTVHQVATINIEDLEDTGFYRLGHQKRLVSLIIAMHCTMEKMKIGTNNFVCSFSSTMC